MGMVWLATDESLKRDVAVKEVVPPAGLTTEERDEMYARSMREARAIARVSHPNVVRIFDVVNVDGRPWIVMERLTGRSLAAVMAEEGPLAPERVADIGLGVLAALRAAHNAGMLHRDVKPANVMVGDDGRVVLTDFGLATLPGDPAVTRTGFILGSPSYIAPERVDGGDVGPAADLWSLGATLYAAVEGQGPYHRPNAMATLAALATEEPTPPRLAGPLKPLLSGLLRKDPSVRMKAAEAEQTLLRVAVGRRGGAAFPGVRAKTVPAQRQPAYVPRSKRAELADAAANEPTPQQGTDRPADQGQAAAAVAGAAITSSETPASGKREARATVPGPAEPAAAPAAAGDRGGSGTGSGEAVSAADGVAPARPGRVRLAALVAAGLAVLVVGAVFLLPRLGDKPREQGAPAAPSTSAAGPSAAPSPSASPSPAALVLPAGWHMYKDRTGFSVAVPKNWRVTREGSIVRFKEPSGGRLLLVDQSDFPKKDPVADWKRQEARRVAAGDWNDYRRVRIEKVDYFLACADWEFTYQGRGGRNHVINRGFVTGPKQAHAIYWSTPESKWQDNLDEFALITASFIPNPK
ncbi:hypothetical protein GCM10009679_39220 [Saccharothrix algeriensis]|uniref:non-specific serine/threonine protein kinase n=3 Tax=Catellatospora bangladeshensis TaxID=310355 RepID=A0A8J3JI69_9ACTN|nr:hypothetical protein Cba03nite_24400 [Catellatospora bangladeshensis]